MNTIPPGLGGRTSRRKSLAAFTLIELAFVFAIISVLIGLLLPAVQVRREENNQTAAKGHLNLILTAEQTYFQANTSYSASFTTLNLAAAFPNNTADGYLFAITTSGNGFVATALPVVPGLNGSFDFRVDQTGKVITSPDPDALAQHQQTSADIQSAAALLLVQTVVESDTGQTDIPAIQRELTTGNPIRKVFLQFAGNGQLTVNDILNYSGLGSAQMAPLLSKIQTDFQWGVGSENTGNITVGLSDVLKNNAATGVRGVALVTQGSSVVTSSTTGGLGAVTAGTILGGNELTLHAPYLLSDITEYQSGGAAAWGGPITLSDRFGNQLGGILVAELPPAVQSVGGKSNMRLDGVVIALNGTAVLTGGAGFGSIMLNFTGTLGDPFTGDLHLLLPY